MSLGLYMSKDWAACDFGFVDDVVHTSHTEAELDALMDKMRGRNSSI